LIPLIQAGFIDWIISTGANFYHDTHFGLGLAMHQGNAQTSDIVLRDEEVVRIYDIFFDYSVLLDTDAFFRRMIEAEEFQKPMSTAEFHFRAGRYVRERERKLGIKNKSILAAAHEHAVPLYTSSPGDSSIGMNVAAKALQGNKLAFDPSLDVNETAAIVLAAKRGLIRDGAGEHRDTGIVSASARGARIKDGAAAKKATRSKSGKSAILILGGGSPKNFALQTEPQIQEVLGIDERGHDYFLQVTDARPDTGGLSGATPGEAVSWGKVDPDRLPDAVVCYLDSTVALPILTAYALAKHKPRSPRRLYDRRTEFMDLLLKEYKKSKRR
jgi:deoxyhypusine synthase